MADSKISGVSESAQRHAAECGLPPVAVVIPTKDRPEFLEEAIGSALNQSRPPMEIIVVDDGSKVPVDGARLCECYGPSVHVIRNDQSRGLAYSRNRGVEEATAEYIIHLDDDDLLAREAIEQCVAVLQNFPQVDLVMFSAEGFGPNADYFNRIQPEGVEHIIRMGKGEEVQPGIVLFYRALFPALLQRVPIAFQRVMSRKGIWETVSRLRWNTYCLDSSVADENAAKIRISGPLRDSEWARYASVVCRGIALINRPLYLQRCAGQGYSSRPENQQLHIRQGIEILSHLAQGAEKIPALAEWESEIQNALAKAYFDAAYQYYHSGDRSGAWRFLREAMSIRMTPKHLKLAVRMCIEFFMGAGRYRA